MSLGERIVSIVLRARDLISPAARTASDSTRALERELNQADRAAAAAGDSLEDASSAASESADGLRTAERAAAGAADEIRDTGSAAHQAQSGLASLARRVTALAGGYLSLKALKDAFVGILSVGGDFERFRAQLDQVMGSVAAGEQASAWIKDFTRKTPFDLAQVTEGFIKLKSFGLDPVDGVYEAIANQAAALGGSLETLEGITLAVGQAWAKGKLQGEEILQLVERGVPVWDLLAKSTGKSATELQRMSAAGELGRQEIRGLIDEIGRASGGALEKQMSTLGGLISNVRDNWVQFVNDIADRGLLDWANDVLGTVVTKFDELRASGRLDEWAQGISDAFTRIGDSVLAFAGRQSDIETFGDVSTRVFDGFARSVQIAGGVLTVFVEGLKSAFHGAVVVVAGALDAIVSVTRSAAETLGMDDFARMLGTFSQSAQRVVAEHTEALSQSNATMKAATVDIFAAILDESATAAKGVADNFAEAGRLTGKALADAVDVASAHATDLGAKMAASESAVAAAIARTETAWVSYYESTGTARADALVHLNASIHEENQLRLEHSRQAQAYNEAVAASERLVAALAAEKSEQMRKAAADASAELDRLGIDTGAAFNEISNAAAGAIEGLGGIASEIQKIPVASDQAARAFEQGVVKALQNVQGAKEFDAIRAKVYALFDAKQIDSRALQAALSAINDRQKEIDAQSMRTSADGLAESLRDAKGAADELSDGIQGVGEDAEDSGGKANGAFDGFGAVITRARESVTALSKAARTLFEQRFLGDDFVPEIEGARGELEAARAEVGRLAAEMERLPRSSFSAWFVETALTAAQVKQAFYEQKVALEDLLVSVDANRFSSAALASMAQTAADRFGLLNDSDLSRLESAIESARSRIESLDQSADRTLENMRRRLAQLRGDTEEVQRLQYESERKQLEAQLEAAQQARADEAVADYREALRQLEEIRRVEQQRTKDAQSQVQAQSRTDRNPAQKVVLEGPGNRHAEVSTDDAGRLLEVLEAAGLRSVSR